MGKSDSYFSNGAYSFNRVGNAPRGSEQRPARGLRVASAYTSPNARGVAHAVKRPLQGWVLQRVHLGRSRKMGSVAVSATFQSGDKSPQSKTWILPV